MSRSQTRSRWRSSHLAEHHARRHSDTLAVYRLAWLICGQTGKTREDGRHGREEWRSERSKTRFQSQVVALPPAATFFLASNPD
jgi:hypothetical protein